MKNYKYFGIINIAFVVVLIISNIVSTKILNLGLFVFDAGTILFPLSYIFADILTEVYGYRNARRVIWSWFFSIIFMALVIMLVWILPWASDRQFQADYDNILGFTPRIVLASLVAYFFWEFSNSYILSKLKIFFKWKKLWIRTIGSTIVGELFDTLIFTLIAFYWIYAQSLLISIIVSNYVFKLWVEVLFTPVTYRIVSLLKKAENEDCYDNWVNYNPLILK